MLLPESLKLHDQGKYEFHYIYFLPWKNQLVEAIEQAGGKVICFSASNNIKILLRAWSIARYVRENKIQLLHAHLPWAGFVGRLVHRITNVPLIYTEHNKQERYHFLTKVLNRFTFNWQSLAIAVSADVENSIQKNIHASIPVKQVLNGVNTDFFVRSISEGKAIRDKYSISPETIVVGTIAVFRFQKRLKEWIDVFAEAASHQPNIVGIIVGDGPLKNVIINHIKKLKLSDKIILPGLQIEVRPWYSAMDIFMMTSVFEGLPVALLEAMSMECAVVTTDAGGVKEVITSTEVGMMKPVEDWKKLSDHLVRLSKDKNKRHTLGFSAREHIVKHFGMKRMVDEIENLYCKNFGC